MEQIISDTFTPKYQEFLAKGGLPSYLMENAFLNNTLTYGNNTLLKGEKIIFKNNDEKISCSINQLSLKNIGNRLFVKNDNCTYISFNKKTNKLSTSSSITNQLLNILIKALEIIWIDSLPSSIFFTMINKTLMSLILKGKIRNKRDFFKRYARVTLKQKNTNWKLLYTLMSREDLRNVNLFDIKDYTTDFNKSLFNFVYGYWTPKTITNILPFFKTFGKKINPYWGNKRLLSEYTTLYLNAYDKFFPTDKYIDASIKCSFLPFDSSIKNVIFLKEKDLPFIKKLFPQTFSILHGRPKYDVEYKNLILVKTSTNIYLCSIIMSPSDHKIKLMFKRQFGCSDTDEEFNNIYTELNNSPALSNYLSQCLDEEMSKVTSKYTNNSTNKYDFEINHSNKIAYPYNGYTTQINILAHDYLGNAHDLAHEITHDYLGHDYPSNMPSFALYGDINARNLGEDNIDIEEPPF